MDLPLLIPRFMVRKMVSDAYKTGQRDQLREDIRALQCPQKEAVPSIGRLKTRWWWLDIAARPARIRPDRQKLVTHIHPNPLPPLLRYDDCGDYHRWPR